MMASCFGDLSGKAFSTFFSMMIEFAPTDRMT